MRRVATMIACVVLAAGFGRSLSAEDVDVTGTWKMTSQTPRGERVSEIKIVQAGEQVTVTSKNRQGEDVQSEGTLKGQEISWTTTRQTPRGEWTIAYSGKVEGRTMSGTMSFGEDRTGEWRAEKVAPAETPAP